MIVSFSFAQIPFTAQLMFVSHVEAIRTNTKKHIIEHCFFSPRDSSCLAM